MLIKNYAFSSGIHTCGVLSVGVHFLGVQHVKATVILLLQYQSIPIPQSIAKYQSWIGNMLHVPHSIQLMCPNWGHFLILESMEEEHLNRITNSQFM